MPKPKTWDKICVPTYLRPAEKEAVQKLAKEQNIATAEFIRRTILSQLEIPESWVEEAKRMGTDIPTMIEHHVNFMIEKGVFELPETTIEPPENLEMLKEENQRLKEEIRRLEAGQTTNRPDNWDKIWEAIDIRRFKTEEQILIDAGILDPLKDGGKKLRELQPDEYLERQIKIKELEETFDWWLQEAKMFGHAPPLEYKAKRGWRRLK